ncbi:MAG: hypothetical protein HC904_01800 [Blastochloris sp.]|nr:hypothetical protein [Blastochloris sp.]
MGIRTISDLATEDVPTEVLSKGYDEVSGKTTPLKMATYLILKPQKIKDLQAFLQPLPGIRKRLTEFLIAAVEEFD